MTNLFFVYMFLLLSVSAQIPVSVMNFPDMLWCTSGHAQTNAHTCGDKCLYERSCFVARALVN